MSKKDYYIVSKNVSKIIRKEATNFLDPKVYKDVISKLKGINYQTYYPYKDSEKVILYVNNPPKIRVLEIKSYNKITHREILGSLYSLNIDSELFGDIIITDSKYYIMVVDSIYSLIINELKMISNNKVSLEEVPIDIITNYERNYESIEIIVSSLRIDNVISRIIGTSREGIKKKFIDEEIILNYEVCHKLNYILNESDIFSIRRYGKYKYIGLIKETKKGNYLIKCNKYIN